MKIPKLLLSFCLISFLGTIPFQTKSQTGNLDACVSCIGGDGIAGAIISVGATYIDTTGTSGCVYFEEIPAGSWSVTCELEGYTISSTMVEIVEGMTTESNFEVYCPVFLVDPLSIEVILEPNQQTTEIISLSNPGLESVDWIANLEIFPPASTDDFLDVQFMYPLSGTTGEKGIECDGTYFYTTSLNGTIYKYDLTSTLIETFSLGNIYSDLAYNGNYFYGAAGTTTIYEMDFNSQVIVSTFTAPGNVRAIAYNHDENIFYGYSWGGDIIAFDPSGILLGSAPVGPSGSNYSGFAYDNVTDGGPYLWGYGLTGSELNVLVQLQLPSLEETGFTVNLETLLGVSLNNVSGGLFTHPDIFPDSWTLGGVVTDEWIWGLELGENQSWDWVSIEPTSGTLGPGDSEEMIVSFDATDLFPWNHEAEIQFSTLPNVGSPIVDVTMLIEGQPGVDNLQAEINCTDVIFTWETIPPGCMYVDSFHVYRDSLYYATTYECQFIDSLVMPEVEYTYYVTGYFYNGWESNQTNHVNVTVPIPENLEPLDLSYTLVGDEIHLYWTSPAACVEPEGYNIYLGNFVVGFTTNTTYVDWFGIGYQYFITAVYYFGESNPSNSIIITGLPETELLEIIIYPNPAKDNLYIQSPEILNKIELLNNIGMIISNKRVNSKTSELDVSHSSPGIYYIKIETEHDMILRKIVIE